MESCILGAYTGVWDEAGFWLVRCFMHRGIDMTHSNTWTPPRSYSTRVSRDVLLCYLVPTVKSFTFIKVSEFSSPCYRTDGGNILSFAHPPGRMVRPAGSCGHINKTVSLFLTSEGQGHTRPPSDCQTWAVFRANSGLNTAIWVNNHEICFPTYCSVRSLAYSTIWRHPTQKILVQWYAIVWAWQIQHPMFWIPTVVMFGDGPSDR